MPLAATIASGAAPVVGGVAGYLLTEEDRRRAREAQEQALAKMMGISLPQLQELQPELNVSQGTLTPELEQEILQGPSAYEQINTDPRLKEAQMNALLKLQEVAQTGITPVEEAELANIRRDVSREDRARREAVLQNMQARGMGGSGAELAAQLASSQAGAERASQEGDRQAALAFQRALEASMKSGQLGGDIRGQDFGEQEKVAAAKDAIDRFNVANRIGTQQRNVGAKNETQLGNLTRAQQLANSNVTLRNQAQEYNKGLAQTQFNNQYKLNQGQASALTGQSNYLSEEAKAKAKMFADIGAGVGQGAGSVGGAMKK